MATLSLKARIQARRLSFYFGAKDREKASVKLPQSVLQACIAAESAGLRTKSYPSVYRDLEVLGFRWFKVHRHWFAIEEAPTGKVIANILFDGSDIPSHI